MRFHILVAEFRSFSACSGTRFQLAAEAEKKAVECRYIQLMKRGGVRNGGRFLTLT